MIHRSLALALLASVALGQSPSNVTSTTSFGTNPGQSTIEPSATQISSEAATATPSSPVSTVPGKAFSRFYQIWLENTDSDVAAKDANQQFFASQGITLTNYWAVTHPSQPNYVSSVSGDIFGMDNDAFWALPANVSTVADMLDTRGISWGEYQENLPYPGFQGMNYSNQVNFKPNYVRKHNPLINFQSVTNNETRLKLIKNFTSFDEDLANKKLPQWAFITPNMTNDAHDTNITFASNWERKFLSRLLNDRYFMQDTLVLLTFDENGTYKKHNKIFSILLGGAIPDHLRGTTDDTFYNHYSTISTVAVSWDLPQLGRWDCNANVFELVANKTGYRNYKVDTSGLYFNQSYPGPLSLSQYTSTWPAPDVTLACASGKGVLSAVKDLWKDTKPAYNYSAPYPYDEQSKTDIGGTFAREASNGTVNGTVITGNGSPSGPEQFNGNSKFADASAAFALPPVSSFIVFSISVCIVFSGVIF